MKEHGFRPRPAFQVGVLYLLLALLMLQVMQFIDGYSVWTSEIEYKGESNAPQISGSKPVEAIPQFVFLVGTEGSGHHLWSKLIEKSPNILRLRRLHLLPAAENITKQLFSRYDFGKSLFAGAACGKDWNGTYLVEQTAHKLKLVALNLSPKMSVPLNGLPETKPTSGMISYPNFRQPDHCDSFRHPELRLLERACQDAQVSCHIILQYRDPIATLRSTVKRKMHSLGFAIALYTAMYQTLTMQLSSWPASSLQFCWDSTDPHPSARLGTLLGYTTDEEFRTAFAQTFIPTTNHTRADVVPPHFDMLLDGLLAAYDQLKTKCLEMQA